MSARPTLLQSEHANVRESLPFFINGTLSELEKARVMRHVGSCAPCQAELDAERRLMDWMHDSPRAASDPDAAWARLERALDSESRARARHRWMRLAGLTSVGVAAAAAMVWLLGPTVSVGPDSSTRDYRTLTSSTVVGVAGGGTIRAVFIPQATVGDIKSLLDRTECQIVGGPSSRGVYTLTTRTGASATHDALAALRASPLVALAEPVGEASAGQ